MYFLLAIVARKWPARLDSLRRNLGINGGGGGVGVGVGGERSLAVRIKRVNLASGHGF